MPIPIVQEPRYPISAFKVLEDCVMCGRETNTWYDRNNAPICPECALSHQPSDVTYDAGETIRKMESGQIPKTSWHKLVSERSRDVTENECREIVSDPTLCNDQRCMADPTKRIVINYEELC